MCCKLGTEGYCLANGCQWEKDFFHNCKNHEHSPIVLDKKYIKKVKKPILIKKIKPIPENLKLKTKEIYDRSNGICYKCGEKIELDEFRIHNSLLIKYSHKKNKKKLSEPIMRASHKKCKI